MKRKISVLMIITLLCMSSMVILNKDFGVEASGGGENSTNLDIEYMWKIIEDLSDVIHKYPTGQIKKGRFFGSWGDHYTARYLFNELNDNLSLDDVAKVLIKPITDRPDRYYTTVIEATSYELTINHEKFLDETGLSDRTLPENDFYPIVSAWPHKPCGSMDHKYDYTNVMVLNFDDWVGDIDSWPAGGTVTGEFLNTSYSPVNGDDIVIGNVSYINTSESMPDEQFCRVFLIDEVQGCDNKLDNVTNASAVILIKNNSKSYSCQSASQCPSPVARINSNEDNLSEILQMLENGTIIFADNCVHNDIITFTYNFSSECIWPEQEFVFVDAISDDDRPIWEIWCQLLYGMNLLPFKPDCLGVLHYDSFNDDTHRMMWHNYNWYRASIFNFNFKKTTPIYALPGFSVNKIVGDFLVKYHDDEDNTISGHMEQVFQEEKHPEGEDWTPGVDAYNVVGHINIARPDS